MSWWISRREDEERQRCEDEHNEECAEAPEKSPWPTVARSCLSRGCTCGGCVALSFHRHPMTRASSTRRLRDGPRGRGET